MGTTGAVILDGMRTDTDLGSAVIEQLLAALPTATLFRLRALEVAPCLGCFQCWVKTPGECVINDVGRKLAEAYMRSELAVWLTPVTFGGYSSELKKALDRLIPNVLPLFRAVQGETHHAPRYHRYPKLLVIGVLTEQENNQRALFQELVQRNSLNLCPPAHLTGLLEPGQSDVAAAVAGWLRKLEVTA